MAEKLVLRCSSLPLAFKCAGSVRPSQIAINDTSEAAELGTAAHVGLAQLVTTGAEEDREWLSFTPTLEEWPCVEHTVAPKSISVQRCEGLLGEHPQYKTSRYPGEWPGREYGQWEVAHYDHCEPLDECPICPGGES